METGRTTKNYCSGSSIITHIIERFLHFTSHLAFSHIMTEIWALFVTSVDSSSSAAANEAALISFASYLFISPIASIKSKNRVCPKIFHCIEIFFIIQNFEQLAFALKNRICPKIFPCIEIFFIKQDFWASCACPENRVCLNFSSRRGGCPPPPCTPLNLCSHFGAILNNVDSLPW